MPNKYDIYLNAFDLKPVQAIEYLKKKNITISKDWEDALLAAEQNSFTVSGVTKVQLLQRLKDELEASLDEGLTFDSFKDNLSDLFEKGGWVGKNASRLRTIYQTNVYQSYNAQRYLQQTKESNILKKQGKVPYYVYRSILTMDTTNICQYLNNIAVMADDKIWSVIYPLNHFNCRGRVLTMTYEEVVRGGFKIKSGSQVRSEMSSRNIVIPKGFDSSPSIIYKPDLSKYDKEFVNEYE